MAAGAHDTCSGGRWETLGKGMVPQGSCRKQIWDEWLVWIVLLLVV